MPISMTQNTPIYTLPGVGRKHAWIFWNKTGQPIFDLWIRTGVGNLAPYESDEAISEGPPLMKRVEFLKEINGELKTIHKVKVERKAMVQLFGSAVLRMDMVLGEKDKDPFLSFLRSNKEQQEINKVLDDVGSHLWTLWEWVGEYTRYEGLGHVVRPEESFTVTIQFDCEFEAGQWIEFIPVDQNGYTINSSNRPDERISSKIPESETHTFLMPEFGQEKQPKKKKKKKKKK